MSRKMKIDKTLEQLRKIHGAAKDEVESLTARIDNLQFLLDLAKDRMIQTDDAINALEGKPTLKKMLEAALQTKEHAAPIITELPGRNMIIAQTANSLPPAEPGFKWAKNEIGQDVLLPENPPAASENVETNYLTLPPVIGEDDFEDEVEDMLK
jgi:hypothetical protein